MKIVVGNKYKCTLAEDQRSLSVTRRDALMGCNDGLITVLRVIGDTVLISENCWWIESKYLQQLNKVIKYNKDKLCQN